MPGNQNTALQVDSRQYITFKNFQGMDTQQERVGLEPNKLAWLENLQIIAPNKLKCVPGPGPALATINDTIFRKFFASYGGADYLIEFGTSGAAYQTNLSSGTVTQFAGPGTFSSPDVTTWQAQRILIADPTSGYCTWDGNIFVQAGGVSPNIRVTSGGSGYGSAPAVAIVGGSGFGATATAQISGGSVIGITLTNPGQNYRAGDVLTVTITGTGNGAAATAVVFPIYGFTQSTIAVAFGRVWIGGGLTLQYSGTAGFDDSNPANAAGFTTITDTDLVHRITALRNLNNFLYIFGDNAVKQIGTIVVAAAQTVFAITTLSSDTGTTFPMSIASYNRVVTFCNYTGVWQIFGATVERISGEMDGVIPLVDFSQDPQAMVVNINSQRCYLLLLKYNDPVQGTRSIFIARQAKRWFVVSQGAGIISAAAAVLNGRTFAYASSGSDVTPILFDPTVAVSVLVQTALDAQQKDMLNKRMLRIGITQFATNSGVMNVTTDTENGTVATSYTLAFPVIWVNSSAQAIVWQNNLAQTVTFVGAGFQWQERQAAGSGIYLGCTLSGSFVGLRLTAIVIEYEDVALMRSRNK